MDVVNGFLGTVPHDLNQWPNNTGRWDDEGNP